MNGVTSVNMNDNRANGPTYDNVGFQHEAGITPPSAPPLDTGPSLPRVTPSYVAVSPNTINTHHTVTPGTPHATRLKTGIKKYQRKYILCVGVSVLLILAIVGILLWYFLSYQCLLGMTCGSGGKCLSSSQWCDGVEDCSHGEDESQCFRFQGTNSMLEGYSSVKQNWVPVCAENWSHRNGRDVCEQMGYSRLDYVTSTQTSAGVSVSKGYMKLKSGGYYGSFIQSHLFYSQKCSVRAVKLQCAECGVSSAAPSGRIVGGTQAAYRAWPWQVSLQINGYHTCGGSIISPYWILSAAHCFQGRNSDPGMWLVQSGGVSLRQMSYSAGKKVNKIISHAKFNTRTNDNDIALLKLNVPFELTSTVKPVCLPNTDVSLSAGDQGWITGWGAKQSAGPTPDQLNQAQVTIYSRQTCNRVEVLNGDITETMICAGKLQGGVDACQGDSGGPLVVKKGGVWWLAGDTSWGIGCALRNKPGVYGNVTYFIDWIHEQMQKE